MPPIAMFTINLAIVLAISSSVISYDVSKSDLGFFATIVIATIVFIAASVWLYLIKLRNNNIYDKSISISGAFWPPNRHPIQYLALMATSLVIGGIGGLVKAFIIGGNIVPSGATFLLSGFSLIAAIIVQYRT